MITYCGLKMHLLMRQLTNVASSVRIKTYQNELAKVSL